MLKGQGVMIRPRAFSSWTGTYPRQRFHTVQINWPGPCEILAFLPGVPVEDGADEFLPEWRLCKLGPKAFRNLTVSAFINLNRYKPFFMGSSE